jgi:high-affinity nickel-transport protein
MRLPPRPAPVLALLIAFNATAWMWAGSAFSARPDLMGLALIAWVFGLRHAVDVDHIAAIDNAVRKLLQNRAQAANVGLYFSLGHSTVVVLASVAIAAAASGSHGWLDWSAAAGGTVGASVSAAFLLLIAASNLVTMVTLLRNYRAVTRGVAADRQTVETILNGRGILARIVRPVIRMIRRDWQMYPVGFLFGLGFDTATEVGLLGIAATQAAQGLPTWYILVFPALFTAGMSLVDTAEGMLMCRAYAWAFAQPGRRLLYNLTITGLSVVLAIGIGAFELLSQIGGKLGWSGGFAALTDYATESATSLGILAVAAFLMVWAGFAVVSRVRSV